MSLRLRLLDLVLRLWEKPRLARMTDPEAARRAFSRQARLLFRDPPWACYLDDNLNGVPATWASVGAGRGGVILYFHGGGYVWGSPSTHRAMLARLTGMAGMRACLPDYRLAPEHPFPAALEDAWTSWRALLGRGYPAERIWVGGDSAGGGLALALLSKICRENEPRPAGAFMFSPWTDLTLSGESLRRNADRDAMLATSGIARIRDQYAGAHDPADPGLSPLFAPFPGCPPVFLQASKAEILLDDTLRMAEALRGQGYHVELDLWEDTPHVWAIFQGWLPEADEALSRVADFIATTQRGQRQSGS